MPRNCSPISQEWREKDTARAYIATSYTLTTCWILRIQIYIEYNVSPSGEDMYSQMAVFIHALVSA